MTKIELNTLPERWIRTTLGDAFTWGSGGTPKRDNPAYYGGDIPWLVIGDLNDGVVQSATTCITEQGLVNSSAKWIEPGSILVAMYGSIGKLGIAGTGLTTNQAIAFTKSDPVEPRYLFWYLRAQRDNLIAEGKGGTQQNISQTVIKAFPFVLAPLPEQRRIVEEIEKQFTRLDAAVESLERARANLKRYRASVLAAACEGRLVPTEAELARQEGRDYEPAIALLDRILTERRARWEADELAKLHAKGKPPKNDAWKSRYKAPTPPDTDGLPELPEGWVWATLDQLTRLITSGSRGWSRYYSASGSLFIRAQDIKHDRLNLNDVAVVDLPKNAEGSRTLVSTMDLLVTLTGANVTKSAIVGEVQDEAYVSQHVGLVRPVDRSLSAYILYWLISPRHGRHELESNAYGAGRPGLNLDNLRDLVIAISPLAEQHRIVEEVERRLSVVEEMERAVEADLQRAGRLRQAILKRAFEGRLVPQDPDDEPASALLERIRAEREQAKPASRSRRAGKARNSQPAMQPLFDINDENGK